MLQSSENELNNIKILAVVYFGANYIWSIS